MVTEISLAELVTLKNGQIYKIKGLSSLYTYQSTATASAVYGSHDQVNWVNIVDLAINDSSVLQQSWHYIKVVGGDVLLRRG